MAKNLVEENWFEYLHTPDAEQFFIIEQQRLIKANREAILKRYDQDLKKLKDILKLCSEDFINLVTPLLHHSTFQSLVKNLIPKESEFHTIEDELKRHPEIMEAIIRCSESNSIPKSRAHFIESFEIEHEEYSSDYKRLGTNHRSWTEMPEKQLRKRLSNGEIIPMDEWIPGISDGRRKLDSTSVKLHINFSKKILEEGRDAYRACDYSRATTLFSQGINVLNWIEGSTKEDQVAVEAIYLLHMKNHALSCLKTGAYSLAIQSCTNILSKIDDHEGKARWIRAHAKLLLGMTEEAKDDYLFILRSPYSTVRHKVAARKGLKDLKSIVKKNSSQIHHIVNEALDKVYFSINRSPNNDQNQAIKQNYTSTKLSNVETSPNRHNFLINFMNSNSDGEECNVVKNVDDFEIATKREGSFEHALNHEESLGHSQKDFFDSEDITNNASSDSPLKCETNVENLPPLNCLQTIKLLEDLLKVYTDAETVKIFKVLWSKADYDERRILLRLKTVLPKIQVPVFKKYGFNDNNYSSNLKKVENCVYFWRKKESKVKALQEACWNAILGGSTEL